MNKFKGRFIPGAIISLLVLWFFIVGGCDVDFGGGDNNGGGGGGGSTKQETVNGTIVDIIPDQDIEGILVEITLNDFLEGSDLTNSSGVFEIEGTFAGSPKIKFLDSASESLGEIFLDVFPTAEVELGDIRLESGNIIFEDETDVTFDAEVTSNNCSGNSGSLEVNAKNDEDEVNVIVQISESTDLVNDGDDITCTDIFLGDDVEVQGELLNGSNVDATRIEVN
ncbi:MAG: hypothetical protein RIG61_05610 [Deltaproteobacteria bacterium]